MIWNDKLPNREFCPFIKTEETIIEQLSNHDFSEEYEIMPYPLAHWINTIGLDSTNTIIENVLNSDRRRVFICQHVLVGDIRFKQGDIVFTPHSSLNDNFFSIPHYAVNFDVQKIAPEKKFKFSFIGSTETHWTRKYLTNLYSNFCFDSGQYWGLDKKLPTSFRGRYVENLGSSEFSICPRGTGISSVRLFESMAMNSIPIIVADGYKKPLSDFLNWDDFSLTVKESEINKIKEIVDEISPHETNLMREKLQEVYWSFFSNENLSKTCKLTLEIK